MNERCNPIPRNHRLCVFLMVMSFFGGLYLGSTTSTENHQAATNHNQQILNNCIEVMIGKKTLKEKKKKCGERGIRCEIAFVNDVKKN